jgi:hypothetical protein
MFQSSSATSGGCNDACTLSSGIALQAPMGRKSSGFNPHPPLLADATVPAEAGRPACYQRLFQSSSATSGGCNPLEPLVSILIRHFWRMQRSPVLVRISARGFNRISVQSSSATSGGCNLAGGLLPPLGPVVSILIRHFWRMQPLSMGPHPTKAVDCARFQSSSATSGGCNPPLPSRTLFWRSPELFQSSSATSGGCNSGSIILDSKATPTSKGAKAPAKGYP